MSLIHNKININEVTTTVSVPFRGYVSYSQKRQSLVNIQQRNCFRPLSGLCLLFFTLARGISKGFKTCFRPLSGLCLLFTHKVKFTHSDKSRFPSPFGVMSLIHTRILQGSNRRTCFRPLSGLCLLFKDFGSEIHGRTSCFRPLSGLCLLFTLEPAGKYAAQGKNVSVPFRGYVSYSDVNELKKLSSKKFPSPFGVMSLIHMFAKEKISKVQLFPSPFGVMSLILISATS